MCLGPLTAPRNAKPCHLPSLAVASPTRKIDSHFSAKTQKHKIKRFCNEIDSLRTGRTARAAAHAQQSSHPINGHGWRHRHRPFHGLRENHRPVRHIDHPHLYDHRTVRFFRHACHGRNAAFQSEFQNLCGFCRRLFGPKGGFFSRLVILAELERCCDRRCSRGRRILSVLVCECARVDSRYRDARNTVRVKRADCQDFR